METDEDQAVQALMQRMGTDNVKFTASVVDESCGMDSSRELGDQYELLLLSCWTAAPDLLRKGMTFEAFRLTFNIAFDYGRTWERMNR